MMGRVATLVIAMLTVMSVSVTALAQEECRGTKKWYAGKCRYPKDIETLKQQAAANKAEEQRRQEEARRRAAEDAKRQADAKKRDDDAACELARVANTVASWKDYLKSHADGACLDEAIQRITELSGERPDVPKPPPSPEPTEPDPAMPPPPPPVPAPEPKKESSSGVSPLVWIGFGVGGLGLLVGSITGAISFAQSQSIQDECDGICPSDRQGDVDEMLALAHTSTAMFVLAGVGVTVGVIGLFLGGSDDDQARLDVHVGPGSLSLTGTF